MPRPRTVRVQANSTRAKLSVEHDGTVLLVDTEDQVVPRGVIGAITLRESGWKTDVKGILGPPHHTQQAALEDLLARHLTKHRVPKENQ